MTERFHLRFESGDRRGETVPVPRAGLLVGRREGNDLRIADPSVSGRHALVRPDDDGLSIEDLGSTNGTLVDGQKVERGSVTPGQALRFGKIEFAVVDTEASPQASAPTIPAASDAGGLALEDEITLGDPAGGAPLLEDEIDLGSESPADAAAPMPAASVPAAAVPASPTPAATPAAAPAARPSTAPTTVESPAFDELSTAAGELHSIDESALERSRRSRTSPLVTIAVVLLLLGGGGAAAFVLLGGQGGGPDGAVASAPLEVPGNLIAGGDLEGEDAESVLAADEAGGRFLADREYASTGQSGLGLAAQRGAMVRSGTAPVRTRIGQSLAASASVYVTESATARVGLELLDSTGQQAPVIVWSAAPTVEIEERLEARAVVPAGYDQARLWIAAGDGSGAAPAGDDDYTEVGDVAIDDLALAPTTEPAAASLAVGDFELAVSEPGAVDFQLGHIAAVLLTGRVADADGPLADAAQLRIAAGEAGRARVDLTGAASKLFLDLRPALIGDDSRSLATTGQDGYRARSGQFESSGVESLVLGKGVRLTRILFDAPVDVRGRERNGRQGLEVDLAGTRGFNFQLSFQAELEAANVLAARARAARRDDRLGDALALWGELLSDFPYEEGLVGEADAARSEIIGGGLAELREVEEAVERARFFALEGIYARCAASAEVVADRYRPTEGGEPSQVSVRADALLEAIRAEREGLGVVLAGDEPARRGAILDWLERNEADDLASRLREAVDG